MNILNYLENASHDYGDKVAFVDEECNQITFLELSVRAKSIGSFLLKQVKEKPKVVIFMKKSISEIVAFLGTVYAGGFYVPIDREMPLVRIDHILCMVKPDVIICDDDAQKFLIKNKYFS